MINTHSETWLDIKAHLTQEIEDNRKQLESPICPHDTANILRGRIMAARDLLELPEEQAD